MSNPPLRLASIQNWMQAVVMHPTGVEDGIAEDTAKKHIPVEIGEVESVIERSNALSSIDRLAVYSNAYVARLVECMENEFPAVAKAIGEESFASFAIDYVQRHPSESYTLGNLGAKFPQYLADTRPPRENAQPDWADFLIDLATLERTYAEVFDGPGIEQISTLSHKDILAIEPETWPSSTLAFAPCVRLLQLEFPAHEFASAVRRGDDMIPPDSQSTFLVVTRREYVVRRFVVSPVEFELLRQLLNGQCIGDAIVCAAQLTDDDDEVFAQNLQEWFRSWAKCGLIIAVNEPQ